MSETAALMGLIQTARSVGDIIGSLVGLRVSTEVAAKIADAQNKMNDLIQKLTDAYSENASLTTRVRELEAEVKRLSTSKTNLDRYQMLKVGDGAIVYAIEPAERGGEPPHWLCAKCYANGKKSILQHDKYFSFDGENFRCDGCQSDITVPQGVFPT